MVTEKRLIDANALIDKWNKIIKRMVKDSDGKTPVDFGLVIHEVSKEPTVDAVEVVYCEHCVNHGNCLTEDLFRMARIEKPYCCVGKMDGDGNA